MLTRKYVIALALTLLFLLASCSPLDGSVAQEINKSSNLTVNSQRDVLSKDYAKAEKAPKRAIERGDKRIIRLGLKNENILIKKTAVIALGKIKDKQSVPNLIQVLSDNQVVMNGGNEIVAMQTDLNRAVFFALTGLTGLKFDVSDALSSDDVNNIIKQSRMWWKVNQSDDN